MKKLFFYILVAVVFLSCADSEPKNGKELVAAMHNMYKNNWYKTLTFKQATIYYNQDEKVIREQTWFEAMKLPSSLAIKFDSITSGSGFLFKNDSLINLRGGLKIAARKFHHPLLILGFSVYTQSPEKTIKDLKALNIDLSKMKIANWQGKKNYVIGDENGTQFYVEKERLLFTKMTQKTTNNSVSETRFNKYQPLQNGWVSPEVLFFTNGKMTMKEVYSDIKTPELDDAIFDENQFLKATW